MTEQKVIISGKCISALVMLSLLLTFGAVPASGNAQAPDPTPSPDAAPIPGSTVPGRQPPTSLRALSPSGAPGYCPSTGGSTLFENITSVTLTLNPDGRMTLVVQVHIANPTDCVPGEPCPVYDASPEYVNVWIDWDGDKTWEASEKVMDKALTGYLGINYRGTMTAISQIRPPASVTDEPTWLRANLGWAYDPNDPCEESWAWGNVVDKQVHVASPKIKDITVQGVGAGVYRNRPETGKRVRLEANLQVPAGYEVTKCTWTGTFGTKTGDRANKCRYEYTPVVGAGPAANTYGNKNVKLTISYKHIASGATGQASKQHKYKVYFGKTRDDDSDGTPNWFEYWKRALGLDGNVTYQAGVNWGSTNATPHVYIGSNAGSGPEPRHSKTGIDCFYCVTTHELQHYADILYCNNTYGGMNPPAANDTDRDHLPNERDPFPNTVNGAGYAEYTGANAWKGDWEYTARQVENVNAAANLDWANPGKQAPTIANRLMDVLPTQARSIFSYIGSGGFAYDPNPAQAGFTGNYSDYGTDHDGDGQYDELTLEVELDVSAEGDVGVIGGLESTRATVWAETTDYLEIGTHWVTLSFAGEDIYQQREDGPYTISLALDLENWLDPGSMADTYTTSGYHYTDFERPSVILTGACTDTGLDTGSDGLFDLLRINVGLDVEAPGTYTVIGELENSEPVEVARTTVSLSAGAQAVDLDFDGRLVFQHRQNGPYHLQRLRVEDVSGNQVDFIYEAHTTSAYTYSQFQHSGTTIDGTSYIDQGLDVDSDGDYDYLRVEFQINADQEGVYLLLADLNDSEGSLIASTIREMNLMVGPNPVVLDFPGGAIYEHGVDGPHQVAAVALLDQAGTSVDYQSIAHITQAYSYTDFSLSLVTLPGGYRDYGQDADGNGFYNYLNVDIPVVPGDGGVIIAEGRLVDSTGHEIEWAENNTEMDAGTVQTITLSFAGEPIFVNRRDGPFELRDLLVYHTGDPEQYISVSQAHVTAAYSYLDFERAVGICLPLILKGYTGTP